MAASVEERKRRLRERDRKRDYRARLAQTPISPVAAILCAARGRERGDDRTFARADAAGIVRCTYCHERVVVVFGIEGHDFSDVKDRAPP